MKKTLIIISLALIMMACDSKLDIVPLGKSTLNTVNDLECLLNQPYMIYGGATDLETLANNTYPSKWKSVSQMVKQKNSISYAILACDESVRRDDLTPEDTRYDAIYEMINYMNVIISKAPEASGDDTARRRIIAEAHILRAWYHFLAVNIYAAQYDASNASSLGGVPYVATTNVQEQKTKRSIAEVYENILMDCSDEYIADMYQKAVDNPFRGGAELGNGVRALVLLQMKRYDEALAYAQKALTFNDNIEDRSQVTVKGMWELDYTSPNNYLLIRGDNSNLGDYYGLVLTPDAASRIEQGDYLMALDSEHGWDNNIAYGTDGSIMCTASNVHYCVYGIRTENIIYAAAEALIRTGKIKDGLGMIDRVREKRIRNCEAFAQRQDITTEAQAMALLKDAKRIEMLTTCYNFFDCKRWNSEPAYAETIVHDLGEDGRHNLTPESSLWIFPFPQNCRLFNPSLTNNY